MSDDTARAAGEGMSEERLAEIRRRHDRYRSSHNHMGAFACCSAHNSADTVPELLAEVERLRDLSAELSETLDVRHDETQRLRARLAEIGDEWSYETLGRTGWRRCTTPMTEEYARKRAGDSDRNRLVHRKAGQWREVPDA